MKRFTIHQLHGCGFTWTENTYEAENVEDAKILDIKKYKGISEDIEFTKDKVFVYHFRDFNDMSNLWGGDKKKGDYWFSYPIHSSEECDELGCNVKFDRDGISISRIELASASFESEVWLDADAFYEAYYETLNRQMVNYDLIWPEKCKIKSISNLSMIKMYVKGGSIKYGEREFFIKRKS